MTKSEGVSAFNKSLNSIDEHDVVKKDVIKADGNI